MSRSGEEGVLGMQKIGTWDGRLVRGMTLPGIAPEVCDALVTALGALGCEAEFGVELLARNTVLPRPTHAQGDRWLRQCYGLCQRLIRLSAEYEVAAQGYLTALEQVAARSDLKPANGRHRRDSWAAQFDATPDVWWPERGDIAPGGEGWDFWLRRAGYSYRHVVTIGLTTHLEALSDALHLVLHALRTLPPGGVLTLDSLALGLHTLSATFEGDLIPHHMLNIDDRHVGLLTAITAIARLDAGSASLPADIAWARGELERARAVLRGGRNGPGRATRPITSVTGNLWAKQLVAEWESIVALLESLRVAMPQQA
jgi:hypothetical protein